MVERATGLGVVDGAIDLGAGALYQVRDGLDVARIREQSRRHRIGRLGVWLAPLCAYLWWRALAGLSFLPFAYRYTESQKQLTPGFILVIVLCNHAALG